MTRAGRDRGPRAAVGLAAAACAACCAGPVISFVAALGLGAAGAAAGGLVLAAVVVAVALAVATVRRRRAIAACRVPADEVAVTLGARPATPGPRAG